MDASDFKLPVEGTEIVPMLHSDAWPKPQPPPSISPREALLGLLRHAENCGLESIPDDVDLLSHALSDRLGKNRFLDLFEFRVEGLLLKSHVIEEALLDLFASGVIIKKGDRIRISEERIQEADEAAKKLDEHCCCMYCIWEVSRHLASCLSKNP